MRKSKIMLVLPILILFILAAKFSCAQGISVLMDNVEVVFDAKTGAPFIDAHARTQVPFRVVLEQFGCVVQWDQTDKMAIAEKNGIVVKVPIGKPYILINGAEKPNDTAAQIRDGRTYLPIRAVLEAYGASVAWNQYSQSVIVDSSKKTTVITPRALAGLEKTTVKYVIDGDTIVIESGEKVRMIGVDTPEIKGPYTKPEYFGEEASAFTNEMLDHETVYLEKDISETDKYGRLLRYVYLEDGVLFNRLLLEEGYAYAVVYPPDIKFAAQFEDAEKAAEKNRLGVWATQ